MKVIKIKDFSNLNLVSPQSKSILIFKKNDKYGWIDVLNGKIIGEDFDRCWEFENNFGKFQKNNKFGWIDTSGKIIVEELEESYHFRNGFAYFKKNGKDGFLNQEGVLNFI